MSKLSAAWRLLRTNRPQMLLVMLDKLKLTSKVPDKPFIKLKYWAIFGKPLNLKDPKTFNEKMQWLKLYDRRPEYAILQDKYRAREYVAAKIGEERLIPLLGVWERAEDIDFDALPDEFVLKCNHDAGSVILCRNKGELDRNAAIKKLNACLEPARQYWFGREWVYKDIPPLVMAEKYIDDGLNKGGGS